MNYTKTRGRLRVLAKLYPRLTVEQLINLIMRGRIMKMKIVVPKGTKELVSKIFKDTDSYVKTKKIMKDQYNVTIKLVPVD